MTSAEILAARGPKNAVDPQRPYAFLVEEERSASCEIVPIATLFLTNRECPFRCLMCDLWQNTTDETVPLGAIPAQIDYALQRLPPARQIKLYNSGNFFDPQAIPREDYPAIIERVRRFENVIVENHPRLTSDSCVRFRDQLGTQFEVALGLETIHPEVLPALNKQMTVADLDHAAQFLVGKGIAVRAFILLRPPYLSEVEGVDWAIRSIEHAFSVGIGCCSVIATRAGNGIMERLQGEGFFAPPTLRSLEAVLTAGIAMNRGRVFVDLWGAEQFSGCDHCGPARLARLRRMNLSQALEPEVICDCKT
jgi:radical SAM enzyme (TIGR01210 family)